MIMIWVAIVGLVLVAFVGLASDTPDLLDDVLSLRRAPATHLTRPLHRLTASLAEAQPRLAAKFDI
jgi:hypothetical protein